jgi:hypothetical protein
MKEYISTTLHYWRKSNLFVLADRMSNSSSPFNKLTHVLALSENVEEVGPSLLKFNKESVYYNITIELKSFEDMIKKPMINCVEKIEENISSFGEEKDVFFDLIDVMDGLSKYKVLIEKKSTSSEEVSNILFDDVILGTSYHLSRVLFEAIES